MRKQNWFRKHRLPLIIAGGGAVVVLAILLGVFLLSGKKAEVDKITQPTKPAEPTHYYSPLTGRETTEAKTTAPVLAVMIENSPEARPQSGLIDAGVVFEAVAEGGITRFVALYQETEPTLIGPVRSVRPYYLDWAAAFDPSVAHVGGSDEAIKMVRGGGYGIDLDQFFNDSAFWRSKDRRAPHNVYTDYAHLNQLLATKGKTSSKFTGFTRADVPKPGTETPVPKCDGVEAVCEIVPPITSIDLAISSGQFAVHYAYDAATDTYKRSLGGKPHLNRALDGVETQIAPDVVVAMRVNQTLMADRLHNQIATTSGGEVFVFQNGQVTKGTWSKDSPTAQLKFLNENSEEIKLKRGQVWLTAVPNGKGITWE